MISKATFLLGVAILGVVICLGVYQVPQPWRGVLVAWILFMSTAGVFVLRVLRVISTIKIEKLRANPQPTSPRPRRTARQAKARTVTSKPARTRVRIE
jgi:hypothetical protein